MNSVDYSWSGSQSKSVSQRASHMMGMPSASFDGVFSRSRASETRAMEDDALRWAALEKLPTYDRLRTGFIRRALDSYEASEDARRYYKYQAVDVANMGLAERQEFITRIFKEAEEDNDTFLKKLRNRIDKKDHTVACVSRKARLASQKTAAYISQNDVHAGEMTVNETLDFSFKCQGVGDRNGDDIFFLLLGVFEPTAKHTFVLSIS